MYLQVKRRNIYVCGVGGAAEGEETVRELEVGKYLLFTGEGDVGGPRELSQLISDPGQDTALPTPLSKASFQKARAPP